MEDCYCSCQLFCFYQQMPSQACGMLLANNSIDLTHHLLSGLNTRSEICVSLIPFEDYFYELQDLFPEET